MVTPGNYKVRLTVNGRTFEQPLVVGMDPRVDVADAALAQQLTMEQKILDLVAASYESWHQAGAAARGSGGGRGKSSRATSRRLRISTRKAQRLQGRRRLRRWRRPRRPPGAGLRRAESHFGSLASIVDGQDAAPTPVMQTAYEDYCRDLATAARVGTS